MGVAGENRQGRIPTGDVSRHRRRGRGMAMVEMVFVLPLLMLILFALIELSVLFGRWQILTNATREGARLAIVYREDCSIAEVEAEVRQRVQDYASPLGIDISDGNIEIDGACEDEGNLTRVRATFPYTFQVLPRFASSVSPTIDLVGRSVMRNEGTGGG